MGKDTENKLRITEKLLHKCKGEKCKRRGAGATDPKLDATGSTGATGPKLGATGATGSKLGATGATGSKLGATGTTGTTGATGAPDQKILNGGECFANEECLSKWCVLKDSVGICSEKPSKKLLTSKCPTCAKNSDKDVEIATLRKKLAEHEATIIDVTAKAEMEKDEAIKKANVAKEKAVKEAIELANDENKEKLKILIREKQLGNEKIKSLKKEKELQKISNNNLVKYLKKTVAKLKSVGTTGATGATGTNGLVDEEEKEKKEEERQFPKIQVGVPPKLLSELVGASSTS